jgi:CHAT domain-containing protein
MASESLLEQLLALPDKKAQKQFLQQHLPLVDGEFAATLKDRATQYLRSDIRLSLRIADLLSHLAELTNNPADRALSLLAEANACAIGLGKYKEGISLYEEAARIYESEGLPVDQARSQVGKIWALVNLSRYDEALEAGQWASRILEDQGEWQILAGLTMNMAIVYGLAGDDARSLEMFDRVAEIYCDLGAKGEGEWLHLQQNRAVALRNLGRFDEAIETSEAAWTGLERLGQKVAAGRARQGLAVTYFILGRYNEALEHLDDVENIFLTDGRHRDAMLVELYVSDCLLQLRRFPDVLDKCRRMRSVFSELGMRHTMAQAVVNEAVAYAELGHHEQALDSLAEARQAFAEEGNRVWVASTDLEKAAVLLRLGRPSESLAQARECAAVFRKHDLPVEEAQAHLVAAYAAFALGEHDRALRLTSEALTIGEKRNVPTLRYRSNRLLGDLAFEGGDTRQALTAYDRAIRDVERLRGRLMVEFRVGFVEDKEEIYGSAVDLCLILDEPLRALDYAERAKSRALLDLLAYRLDLGVQVLAEADRPLVEEMMHLRAERDRRYRRWESDAESEERGWATARAGPGQAHQEILALEQRITELWHRLLIRNADYAREAALWTVHTEPAQSYLALDALLIEYFIVRRRLVVFLVTASDVAARRLDCDLDEVRSLMQRLWLNLKAVPRSTPAHIPTLRDNARGLLRRLDELVLAPLSDVLDSHQQVIVVPHGPLHYLPFHALHDGAAYLLERHEFSYLPGASFLRHCSEASAADSGVLALGHSHNGRLPHAIQEAHTVSALLEGMSLVEERATRVEFQRLVPGCRTLHLAAHGDFRPDNPLFSGLALADGWLTTLDIFNLHLNASLVTLSACQTGRSVVGGGDELLGLMRAFLYAGAASLVLSLWAVEDRSTALLMETFYRKMAEGWTKGRALRHAQLTFLNERGSMVQDHPYFWAPFFLVGHAGTL